MTTGTCECGQPLIGVEVRGFYDGVLFWQCALGHMTHRFHAGHYLRDKADRYAAQFGHQMREVPGAVSHD
jgi:hypothetical protein